MNIFRSKAALCFLEKYWFLLALLAVTAVTLADLGYAVSAGRWLKNHRGPDLVIFLVFLFSGLTLDGQLIRKGLGDLKATLATLTVVFVFSPMVAALFFFLPLDIQIITGLFLVAVMPSTLSSGVVMADAAGGNGAMLYLSRFLPIRWPSLPFRSFWDC